MGYVLLRMIILNGVNEEPKLAAYGDPTPAESAADEDSPTAPLTSAQRLKHVFDIDILVCLPCGGMLMV